MRGFTSDDFDGGLPGLGDTFDADGLAWVVVGVRTNRRGREEAEAEPLTASLPHSRREARLLAEALAEYRKRVASLAMEADERGASDDLRRYDLEVDLLDSMRRRLS